MARGTRTRGTTSTDTRGDEISMLLMIVIPLLVLGACLGVIHLNSPRDASVEGNVLRHERQAAVLGANGWIATSQHADLLPWTDDRVGVIRNVLTGEELVLAERKKVDMLLPHGGYLTEGWSALIHDRSGAEVADIRPSQIGDGVAGLGELVSGNAEVAGVSDGVIAFVTCYSAVGAAVNSGAPGGHVVMAGFRIADGRRLWAHDTGVGCEGSAVFTPPDQTLGAIEHVVIRDGDRASVIRIDDGENVATWPDTPQDALVVQGSLALRRIGGTTAEVVDLASGETLAGTECPDLRLMSHGPVPNLSPEATLAVVCGDQDVHVYDAGAQSFTPVGVPPLASHRRIVDGAAVVHDRYILRREGETVTITDALDGAEVGSFSAPEDMAVHTGLPRGRVMVLRAREGYEDSGDDIRYREVIVDLRTGAPLLAESEKLGSYDAVDPTGLALIGSEETRRVGRGDRLVHVDHFWVVGIEERDAGG